MLPATSQPAIRFVPLFIGISALLTAVFFNQVWSLWGRKPLEEMFISPRLRRSARINIFFVRLLLTALGMGALLQGIGELFLTPDRLNFVAFLFLGVSILLILLMGGAILRFWSED
jgi:hypothetical protein